MFKYKLINRTDLVLEFVVMIGVFGGWMMIRIARGWIHGLNFSV